MQHKDVCIIGAGSGGLAVAEAAVDLGLKVCLIERHKIGGSCLYAGCVPSKSLLSAARCAHTVRQAPAFGIMSGTPHIDFSRVQQHIRGVINNVAMHESESRIAQMGVDIIHGDAQFVDPNTITVGDQSIRAKHVVIATGARPLVPDIPGLDKVAYYTNETIFDLTEKPKHLLILGGSTVGCEMAQAFAELDVPVTLIERQNCLQNYDRELVAVVREQLLQQGIKIFENFQEQRIELRDKNITIAIRHQDNIQFVSGSHLLIATGRKPATASLNLAAAGIEQNEQGIVVDRHLRTTNKRVYALGDVVGGYHFMHAATYQADVVVRNALLHWPTTVDYATMPLVVYTAPELVQVGVTEQQSIQNNIQHEVLRIGFKENDRAKVEHDEAGALKVLINSHGEVLGVGIVGFEASELIAPWIMAMQNNIKIHALASLTVPYPTRSELTKQIAQRVPPSLSNRWQQRIRRWFARSS